MNEENCDYSTRDIDVAEANDFVVIVVTRLSLELILHKCYLYT